MNPIYFKAALNLIIAGTAAAFISACSLWAEPHIMVVTATPQPTPLVVTATPEPTLVVHLSVEAEPTSELIPTEAGALLKGSGGDVFYLTEAGTRRHIFDQATFQAFGFRQTDVVTIADETLSQIPQAAELTRLVFDHQDNLYWVAAGRRWQVNEWQGVIERADYQGIPATPLAGPLPTTLPVQGRFETGTLLRAGRAAYYLDGNALIPLTAGVPEGVAVIEVPVEVLAVYLRKSQVEQTQVSLKTDTPAANVRQAPHLHAEVIGIVQNADKMVAQGRTADRHWLQIIYQGQPGWLAADLAVDSVALSLLPIIHKAQLAADLPEAEPAAVMESELPRPLFCPDVPIRGFGKVWSGQVEVQTTLGCPDSWQGGEQATEAAVQIFQNGLMVWLQSDGFYRDDPVYVFFADGTYQRFGDLGLADPAKVEPIPVGYFEIGDKFSKVYWEGTGAQVKERLGYAIGPAKASAGAFQEFSNGRMFWAEVIDRIFVIYEYGYLEGNTYIQIRAWQSFEDTF